MRTLLGIIFTLCLMTSAHATPNDDKAQLTAQLHEFLAGASRNDANTHDNFWAEDLIYTSSAGKRFGKAEIMAGFKEEEAAPAEPATIYTAEDVRIQLYGTTAIVAFELVGTTTSDTGTSADHYLNSGTFLKRGGKWQVVNWQATKKPE